MKIEIWSDFSCPFCYIGKKRFEQTIQNAKTVGLDFRYDLIKMTNTFDAHRLTKWSSQFELEQQLTDRFMKAYFTEGYNLSDFDTLVKLASEVGLDENLARKVLIENLYANDVRNEISEAKRIGVQGVPFFVVNRKYGISGAQKEAYFLAALEQIWDEDHPVEVLDQEDESSYCTGDNCEL